MMDAVPGPSRDFAPQPTSQRRRWRFRLSDICPKRGKVSIRKLEMRGSGVINGSSMNEHYMKFRSPLGREPYNTPCLSARDKKLISSCSSSGSLGKSMDEDGFFESDLEWRSTPSDLISVKHSINYDCNQSIPINFTEAWSYFETSDLSVYSKFAGERLRQRGKLNFKTKFIGTPLKKELLNEKNLIFRVASCPMDNASSVHVRILQSIYVFFTKKASCSRFGTHWEEVGFQGHDPSSDLRGVGMLGALQMLFLCSSQDCKDNLAVDLYDLSRHPIQQFPLAVLSLNVTKIVLDAYRDGILNTFCNKENSSIIVINRFYLAVIHRIYKKWLSKNATIHESFFLLKSVEKWCRDNPKKTIKQLYQYWFQKSGGIPKKKQRFRTTYSADDNSVNMSWFDLTKPSIEVFI